MDWYRRSAGRCWKVAHSQGRKTVKEVREHLTRNAGYTDAEVDALLESEPKPPVKSLGG